MSSLATHTLYALLSAESLSCERAFIEDASITAPSQQPLRSLETGSDLRDFDFVAITSSYELDWLALPRALEASGIPARREDRGDHPLVLMGGPAVTAAPLPLSGLYDAALIGEVEPVLPELRAALLSPSRQACLERLAATPGFYVPALHGQPAPGALRRRCARDLDQFETASVFLTPHTEFGNRFLLEMGRGCGRGCAFCLARQAYRPLRWRSLAHLLDSVRRGLRHTLDLGLIAAAVSDYPELDALCRGLAALSPEPRVSTSSVRLETASPAFLSLLAGGGQQTVTYAPEAATEPLRQAIGKPVTDDKLFAAIQRALTAGLSRIRLYFMVGLPGEADSDREGIVTLGRQLAASFPGARFRLNVGAFSPRPHTPFEGQPLGDPKVAQGWISGIARALRPVKGLEVAGGSAREAALQGILSRSGEGLLDALRGLPEANVGAALRHLRRAPGHFMELLEARQATDLQPWKVVDFSCAD
jgi:radical SAM superfamily enzyme YgiQ (UPF0313 family)